MITRYLMYELMINPLRPGMGKSHLEGLDAGSGTFVNTEPRDLTRSGPAVGGVNLRFFVDLAQIRLATPPILASVRVCASELDCHITPGGR